MEVHGEVGQRVLAGKGFVRGLLCGAGGDGGAELAVLLGVDGDELAADSADGETVQLQLIEVLSEADKGRRVVGVHHADLLTLEKTLVPGVFLLLAPKLHGAFLRLVLLRFRLLLRFQAFLNDAEVFEVGEFHMANLRIIF